MHQMSGMIRCPHLGFPRYVCQVLLHSRLVRETGHEDQPCCASTEDLLEFNVTLAVNRSVGRGSFQQNDLVPVLHMDNEIWHLAVVIYGDA